LMTKISVFKFVPRPDAVATAFRMLQPAVRFSMDDVTELPETVYRTIDVPLSTEQQQAYVKLVQHFHVQIKGGAITAVNAGVALSKLLQVSGGWVYAPAPKVVALDVDERVRTLIDLIEANEQKVIVYAPYRHVQDGLSVALTNAKIEHAIVHGSVAQGARDKIFNLFQNTNKYKVLLAHPECVSHGLTLTAANTVIWWGPIPNLETYEQANARIIRVGQKHKQQIIHLQGSPTEKKVYRLLAKKQQVQNMLLDLFETATEQAA